jgi:hypothetical protein
MAAIKGSVNFGKGGYALVVKKNSAYAEKLNTLLKGLPKKALAVYAATALDNAIRHTKHDSSRAAANWNLEFGNGGVPTTWNPSLYGTHPVGQRGSGGTYEMATIAYKANFYGYSAEGEFKVPTATGKISKMIGVGQKGTAPVVRLYNPIFSPESLTYAKHAFPYGAPDLTDAILSGAGGGVALSKVSKEFMPNYIRDLGRRIRTAAFTGTI